jgi:2-hydroxychromene-2-carboxylate isomerase
LQKLVERAGLDWNQARPLLNDDSWRLWAQDNLAELYGHDLWGVPSVVYGQTKVFGQDRLDRIEQGIIEDLTAVQ